ncbi:hypothetical protein CAEBREN_02924 [Caenorhabditis brenneri]|uniref:Tyrosine-protein kinase n=1 Tax=Caenorhabditis brenneri TaxID=135651 RepID=G0P7A2_CAEBE|nr:hypothetical protein CAEBREN_02924 [Caenorhabditis brenneri]
MWEVFTLGEEPWGDCDLENVFNRLCAGERLTKPEHCSEEIYELMRFCWKANRYSRIETRELIEALEAQKVPEAVEATLPEPEPIMKPSPSEQKESTNAKGRPTNEKMKSLIADSQNGFHLPGTTPNIPVKATPVTEEVAQEEEESSDSACSTKKLKESGEVKTAGGSLTGYKSKNGLLKLGGFAQSKDSDDEETPMEHEPWFFGRISAQRANELLSHGQEGNFLVRYSERTGDDLAVTRRGLNQNNHFKVQNVDGQLKFRERTFMSMDAFIAYYTTNPIFSSSKRQLYLSDPLPK